MVMLSELLRFRVIGANGENIRLTDLTISQLDKDYPLITHLIYRKNLRDEALLPWRAVKRIERSKGLTWQIAKSS